MTADLAFMDMHTTLFDEFARPVLLVRAGTTEVIETRAVVNEGIERVGEYGQSVGAVTVLDFLATEHPARPRDSVTLLDPFTREPVWTRPVASIDADDGFVVKAVMHG